MAIIKQRFGISRSGAAVSRYTITNQNGASAVILSWGCVVQALRVPDRTGKITDVVLGYNTLEEYERGTCFYGAFIGRYANRIKGSRFTLKGTEYALEPNEGTNHLHGVYCTTVFSGEMDGNSLVFRHHSPDGEEGFPGAVDITVRYTLTNENALVMDYQAVTDQTTVLNFTNHSYFRLGGSGSSALNTELRLDASHFTEGDEATLPTGNILPVDGTPFDFRTAKPIGRDMDKSIPAIRDACGYDHNFVLDAPSMDAPFAQAYSPETGIVMDVYTTQPGVQLYTANYLHNDMVSSGKGGEHYDDHCALCLETQHFPCSPNYPQFPSTVLEPGILYHETTKYQFCVRP